MLGALRMYILKANCGAGKEVDQLAKLVQSYTSDPTLGDVDGVSEVRLDRRRPTLADLALEELSGGAAPADVLYNV